VTNSEIALLPYNSETTARSNPPPPSSKMRTVRKWRTSAVSNCFPDEIAGIPGSIHKSLHLSVDALSYANELFTGSTLYAFSATVTADDVVNVINHMPNKSSPLNELSTSLLKSRCAIITIAITHLSINHLQEEN